MSGSDEKNGYLSRGYQSHEKPEKQQEQEEIKK